MTNSTTSTQKPKGEFTARYQNKCSNCGGDINFGDPIVKHPVTGKYVHSKCGEKSVKQDSKPDDSISDSSDSSISQENKPASNNTNKPKRTKTCTKTRICKKCDKPILKGDKTTPWLEGPKTKFNDGYWWVHLECPPDDAEQQSAGSVSEEQIRGIFADCVQKMDLSNIDHAVDQTVDQKVDTKVIHEVAQKATIVENKLQESVSKLFELIPKAVAEQIAELKIPRRIEVVTPKGETKELKGHAHEAFEPVLALASMRKHIFLPGPAGCGKSHLASQVAEALELNFGFISCSAGMSEGQLTGRLIPTGDAGKFEYVGTQFVDCYENGGVFLCDELDAADPNVLLVINAALANGKLALPNRQDKPVALKHEDFIFIAAANTYGNGADRMYVGRNELDEATLDRFRVGTVPMGYDPVLDKALCPHDELRNRLLKIRDNCEKNQLRRIISTRFLKEAHDMVEANLWTLEQVEETLFSGWSKDEIQRAKSQQHPVRWIVTGGRFFSHFPAPGF